MKNQVREEELIWPWFEKISSISSEWLTKLIWENLNPLFVTQINSEVVTQSGKIVDSEITKTQKGVLSKLFSLMSTNPNYKMLGALGMMFINFSVCVTIAKWLKNSPLVS